ncbi:hypothetical protein BASA81_010162 [Batrachochytrium salamandrivorans]|nr:hypothetical protein BASA81_010162 [Batrachochytrium salamandrivorans]
MEKFVFPFRLAFDWNVLGSAEARVLLLDRAKASLMVDWMDPTRVSTLLLHTIQTVIGNHPGSDFRRFSMKKTEAMTAFTIKVVQSNTRVWGNASQQQHLMPTMLAVLGNHDAIDGGEGFQRLFLEKRRDWGLGHSPESKLTGPPRATSSWVVIGVHDQQAAGANPDIDPEQWYYLSKQPRMLRHAA